MKHNQSDNSASSRLAGMWAKDGLAWVSITPEGFFDWTGTVEGKLERWHQLQFVGDRSFNMMDPRRRYQVVASNYKPTVSYLRIKHLGQDGPHSERIPDLILEATLVNEDKLSLQLTQVSVQGEAETRSYSLYRAPPGTRQIGRASCRERV